MKAYYENRKYSSEIPVYAFHASNFDFVAHWHSDIEIIYVCEGSIGVGLNSEYRVLGKGEIAICGSNAIHYYHSVEGMSSKVMIMIFRPDVISSFKYWPDKLMPGTAFIDRKSFGGREGESESFSDIEAILGRIIRDIAQKKSLYAVSAAIGVVELCMTLFRCLPADRLSADPNGYNHAELPASADIKPMQKALKYIEENFTQNMTLERIAEEVSLSCFYFSRLFKKTTGMNFNVYLTRIRLDKAEALIRSTSKTILEIAYEVGFSSIRTFNRAFRSLKGYTPGSLR